MVHERSLRLAHIYGSTPLSWLVGKFLIPTDPRLRVELPCGLSFRSPIGVAAGYDKFGLGVRALNSLGFSHDEVGTVPPLPQPGNPQPRLFRLLEDKALINRMGFNSPGVVGVDRNLVGKMPRDFVIGINVGANKTSVESGHSVADFVKVAKLLAYRGHYIAVNVSSPNTPGLRDLQHKEALAVLLDELLKEKAGFFSDKPVFVKIAPDLSEEQIDDVLDVVTSRNIDGIIATNTTLDRESLTSPLKSEVGGSSGRPLFNRTIEVVRYIYRRTEGRLPIIGVGGIFIWQDGVLMAKAGASILQMLTGLVYEGPLAGYRINNGLSNYMEREGIQSFREIVGVDA